jgi:hypothetical protein
MKDYLTLGPVPSGEDCAQIGDDDYHRKSREEGARFISLLRQVCGPEPPGARLCLKSFPHDFGTYYEVCCTYEDTNEPAIDYAFHVEAHTPESWDDTTPHPWSPPVASEI